MKPIDGSSLLRLSTAALADELRGGLGAQRDTIRKLCSQHGIHVAPEQHRQD